MSDSDEWFACPSCGERITKEPGTCGYCGHPLGDERDHDNWEDPKYLKPDDCDELGYCVHCGTATIHRGGCIVLAAPNPASGSSDAT